MFNNMIILEVSRGDRIYQLLLPSEGTIGECFDVVTEMRAALGKKINELSQAEEKKDDGRTEPCAVCPEGVI